MSMENRSKEEQKLKDFLVRKFSFMYPTQEELFDTIREIEEKENSFSSRLEMRTFIVEGLKDKIIEEIFTNNKTDMLNRCVEMYYSRAKNYREFGYKEALTRFISFLSSLECTLPYEMIDDFVKQNPNLQFLIKNYLKEENDSILEESILDKNNYYLRNMLICYCDYVQIAILPEEDRVGKSRNWNLGFDNYEYFHQELKQKRKKFTNQEVEELLQKAKNQDIEARNELIVAYLPYVKYFAASFLLQRKTNQVDYMDLIQEGTFAIMKAIHKYDSEKATFVNYVTRWIINYMGRYIKKSEKNLYKTYGSFEELNEKTDIFCYFNTEDVPIEEHAEKENLKETLDRVLKEISFTEREQYLLEKKYGLNNTPRIKIKEIAESLNISKQAISASNTKLLEKIRQAENSVDLIDFCSYPDEAIKKLNKVKNISLKKEQ